MKILQINTVCQHGSIPKIMSQLYEYSTSHGDYCEIAYGRGHDSKKMNTYKFGSIPDFYIHVLKNFIFGQSGFDSQKQTQRLIHHIAHLRPDLIHLHNIHGFYIQVETLFDFLKHQKIPVIWTLHDCWSYTGQCAYYDAVNCEKWKKGCYKCPIFRTSYPYSIFMDNSKNNYIRKRIAFSKVPNLTLVTPSQWLANEVKQSFLHDYPVMVIPNGIDPTLFRRVNLSNNEIRQKLSHYHIADNRPIILGVANIWDKRKGLTYILKMAKKLQDKYLFIIIGLNKIQIKNIELKFSKEAVLPLGRTKNQEELCLFYNLASVYVNPTIEDNFPTTNLEALACGTPVITFRSGGSPEMLDQTCGIVVEKYDSNGLINAVPIAIKLNPENCVNRINLNYLNNQMVQSYHKLYHELIH